MTSLTPPAVLRSVNAPADGSVETSAEASRRVQELHSQLADGHSQEQIGRRLGVSQMQVSRLLVGILARLRDDLGTTLTEATA